MLTWIYVAGDVLSQIPLLHFNTGKLIPDEHQLYELYVYNKQFASQTSPGQWFDSGFKIQRPKYGFKDWFHDTIIIARTFCIFTIIMLFNLFTYIFVLNPIL